MATTVCLDFLMFPDNTPMPLPFTLVSFKFSAVAGGMTPFVNVSGGGKGLQFADQGIKVKLPFPSSKVSVNVGQFAQPISVRVLSATGAILASTVITAPNTYTTKTFATRTKAVTVILRGGNNEGILARICATM
jgi:hypothetical protein